MTADAVRRYTEALHAMQTGVMYQMEPGGNPKETEPKHLRVGINSALIDSGALLRLLLKKGIFTQDEFEEELANLAEAEADDYQERVRNQLGNPNIHLGTNQRRSETAGTVIGGTGPEDGDHRT